MTRSFPQRADLFGNINAYGTPGDTAPATYASGTAKLINPRCQLVRHPLPVARLAGGSYAASVNVGKTLGKAGIPLPPAFRVVAGHIAGVFHRGAEASGTNHGAIGASQAAGSDVVPARMVEILMQQLLDPGVVDAANLLAGGFLHAGFRFLQVRVRDRGSLHFVQYLGAALASRPHQEAMAFRPQQFGQHQVHGRLGVAGNSRPSSHGSAKTRRGRLGALDGD